MNRKMTSFTKLTTMFITFGLIPILLLSLLFVLRFNRMLQDTVSESYLAMTEYVTGNVGEVLSSADEAMAELYSYTTSDGRSLAELLKSGDDNGNELQNVLQAVMNKSPYITGIRFVSLDGNVYSRYYSQDKVLNEEGRERTQMGYWEEGEDLTTLKLLGSFPESEIAVNASGYVFSMVRNYMDISTVESTSRVALGTLFADIDVDQISDIVNDTNLMNGKYYIYCPDSQRYIYCDDGDDYLDGSDPLAFCKYLLDGSSGVQKVGRQWVIYEKIEGMDVYGVLLLDKVMVQGTLLVSRSILILILCFACGFLLVMYMMFSIRMSEPTRKLKMAMEKVEQGDLSVRVDIRSGDEMEYVADGFNGMAEHLEKYIREVYMAKICQKDAELNALKMQIQPHYLYNTLDVIRMTALEHEDMDTVHLLESLSHQLRYVIGNQADRVPIREELDALREYFVIMKARYENRFSLMISIDDKDCELKILKLLLQPMVENAIRHGLREREGYGAVAISVERKEEYLQIEVIDDGVGMSEEALEDLRRRLETDDPEEMEQASGMNIGMKNAYDRIKLDCGEEYGYSIQSTRGVGTCVTFRLPIWEDEQECGN